MTRRKGKARTQDRGAPWQQRRAVAPKDSLLLSHLSYASRSLGWARRELCLAWVDPMRGDILEQRTSAKEREAFWGGRYGR